MGSLFLLLGCNLSYIVDLFAALHELASASAHITKARIINARALKTVWRHLKHIYIIIIIIIYLPLKLM